MVIIEVLKRYCSVLTDGDDSFVVVDMIIANRRVVSRGTLRLFILCHMSLNSFSGKRPYNFWEVRHRWQWKTVNS